MRGLCTLQVIASLHYTIIPADYDKVLEMMNLVMMPEDHCCVFWVVRSDLGNMIILGPLLDVREQ